MTNELDEWKTKYPTKLSLGRQEVHEGEQRKGHAHKEADGHLEGPMLPPPAR